MGITNIDPVHHGLLFERFLNPERKSMPDIDTDFCIERRDEVIEYVTRRYGEERVAQIITFNRMTSKAVLKDVARVLDIPYAESDRMAKMIPVARGKPTKLKVMISDDTPAPEFKEKYDNDPQTQPLARHGHAHRGHQQNLWGACGRGGDFQRSPGRNCAPAAQQRRPGDHPVLHGRRGSPGSVEDGLPGAEKPHHDPERRWIWWRRARGVAIDPDDLPMDDPATLNCWNGATWGASSSWNLPGCGRSCEI
jgi:DNA polymerase-3 subunit alpha